MFELKILKKVLSYQKEFLSLIFFQMICILILSLTYSYIKYDKIELNWSFLEDTTYICEK